jgi:toxin-antitoxin system PIN domain toxin
VIYGLDTNVLVYAALADLPEHEAVAGFLRAQVVDAGNQAAIVPQVLYEYVHIATDGRRFERPLSMTEALESATRWATAREVVLLPESRHTPLRALSLLGGHRLGRKRILDAALAATLLDHGVDHLVTHDRRHFERLGLLVVDPVGAG